jgi:hypothetical protein
MLTDGSPYRVIKPLGGAVRLETLDGALICLVPRYISDCVEGARRIALALTPSRAEPEIVDLAQPQKVAE